MRSVRNSIQGIWSVLRKFLRDLFVIVVLGVVFYFLYNTPIPGLGKSVRSFVQYGTSELLTLLAAIAVAMYAYKSVYEMTKDRRKDVVEKKLEKVYTPIYEILLGAREKGRAIYGPSMWALPVDDEERIKDIMRQNGHYFKDKADLDRFRTTILEKGKMLPASSSLLYEETVMGPVFDEIIEREKEALTKEFRELTEPPRSPTATENESATSQQERSAPQPPSEPASGLAHKTRLERFDEVFRTLLVIATVLTTFSLATTGTSLAAVFQWSLAGVFQMTLVLLVAVVLWAVAVLWGVHPMAHATRLASLELLSLHLMTILSVLFLMIPPTIPSQISFSEGLLVAMTVDSIAVFVPGAIYLRLNVRAIGVALLLTAIAMFLWVCTMTSLYP